jgi:2',3'-cyclic-nucleotide 2'-phosphodiesterase (5'-nucleotidase family)
MIKQFTAAFLGCVLAATLAVPCLAQNAKVTLLHVNDVYEISPVKGQGGLAELMTLLRRERREHANTITTVSGDFLSPSILSGITKGAQMVALFNALGVDLVTFGNHEFDFGPEILKARMAEAKFPFLGTNVRDAAGQPFGGAVATVIKQVGDVKIGFLGIATPESAVLSSAGPDIRFTDPVAASKAALAELRASGAHIVVALTHLGVEEDRALSRAVPGIDVILGGHDHEPVTFYEHGALLHKSGADARFLGAIDLDIRTEQTTGGKLTTVRPSWRMIANAGVAPDPEIAAIVKTYTDRLDSELGKVIGKTAVELDSRIDTVRTGEARIGNLIADALRDSLGADLAITNGGGIRGNRVLAAGSGLTRKDILTELPFGNLDILIELRGADLLAALENGVSAVEQKAGRFPQISGMTVTYDPKAESGKRIRAVTIGGQKLAPDASYRVATSDYLAGGGDGYAALTRGKILSDTRFAQLLATAVGDYIERQGTVSPQLEGRITAHD